jgi:hypothetical protein
MSYFLLSSTHRIEENKIMKNGVSNISFSFTVRVIWHFHYSLLSSKYYYFNSNLSPLLHSVSAVKIASVLGIRLGGVFCVYSDGISADLMAALRLLAADGGERD